MIVITESLFLKHRLVIEINYLILEVFMGSKFCKTYLQGLNLAPRWSPLISLLVNTFFILLIFAITWWIFQDPRGVFRLYTPYVGYMYCRWILIAILLVSYVFDYWPFKYEWLDDTHPILKGAILTLLTYLLVVLITDGFFKLFLGQYGITYFSPQRMTELGITEFYAVEYASTAIMMFAVIASWLAPSWVAACDYAPWQNMSRFGRGMSVSLLIFFLSLIIYLVTMHSHMAILYYPWQEFTAITPPYWEQFANTVSGNFHIAWIMCCTVVVWLYEFTFEKYPFCYIKIAWLRRVSAFLGIVFMAVCLCFFLYYVQELAWGEAIRGTRRQDAPDWRWLHVGEMAIFWLVPSLYIAFYCNNWPNSISNQPLRILVRTAVTIIASIAIYMLYYRYAHDFLGTQKGYSHPQQFPMIPMIWLINIFLINYLFMDKWPGWKRVPHKLEVGEQFEVYQSPASFWKGVILGGVLGGIIYFCVIYIIPVFSKSINLIP